MMEAMALSPVAYSIGWALLQFIWQGTLVGAVTAALLAGLRHRSSEARYFIACFGLLVMIALPTGMAFQSSRSLVPGAPPGSPAIPESGRGATPFDGAESSVDNLEADPQTATESERFGWTQEDFRPVLPLAVIVWLSGVIALSVRIMGVWVLVGRIRCRGTTVAPEVHAHVKALARRLRVSRAVRVLESTLVEVPTVVGWLRPVILLPASVLSGLPSEQIEALLAHELAHIRRHDYLVNALQTVVETLLFYHPAVWWVSHRIRVEREHRATISQCLSSPIASFMWVPLPIWRHIVEVPPPLA